MSKKPATGTRDHKAPLIYLPSAPKLIRPLTPHESRMRELRSRMPVTDWDLSSPEFREHVRRALNADRGERLRVERLAERLSYTLFADLTSGCGLPMSEALRAYVREYADRMIKHGPYRLPLSFNIAEAFLWFDDEINLFRLRNEKDHLLNLSEYLNWHQSQEILRLPIVKDSTLEATVYSFDFASHNREYKITGEESEFVLASVSLVRHGSELSVMLVAGENPPLVSDEDAQTALEEVLMTGPLRPADDLGVNDRYLDVRPEYARTVVLTRMDLDSGRYDVRHFALDLGPSFQVITDDPAVWASPDNPADFDPDALTRSFQRYMPLFDALTSLVYLPTMFADLCEQLEHQRFATTIGSRRREKPFKKAIQLLGMNRIPLHRKVACLPGDRAALDLEEMTINTPDLEMNVEGFWRPLPPGQVGEDRDGEKVVGRTWVTRHESWPQTATSSFLARRRPDSADGPDPGAVYVVRCEAHQTDTYKIGLTRRDPEVRSRELSGATGVPLPFGVIANWNVGDCARVEKEVHSRLAAYRVNPRREFFHCELRTIIRTISEVIESIDRADEQDGSTPSD